MKTQRVRIYCLMDSKGRYNAAGFSWRDTGNPATEEDLCFLHDGMDDAVGDVHGCWIEADVPIPEVPVIEGEVSK